MTSLGHNRIRILIAHIIYLNQLGMFNLIIKPTRCNNFQIYFLNRTLRVSDSFSAHHQESSTVHTEVYTGNADCLLAGSGYSFSAHHQEASTVHTEVYTGYADCLLAGSGWNILIPLASSQHYLYIPLCVQC
jgi:hypothetical protein